MTTSRRQTLVRSVLATAAVGGALATGLATAGPASAAPDGTTVAVCQQVHFRSQPKPDGWDDGTLNVGDNVHVYSHVGNGMVSVHAYGDIHRDGYVLESALC